MENELQEYLQEAVGEACDVERELAGDGLAHAYLARDLPTGQRLVIKALRANFAGGISGRRFHDALERERELRDPYIVPILTVSETRGIPYYVQPYVPGESLRLRLGRGALAIGEAAAIMRDIARALAHAHERGLVHRDLTPDAIILSTEGRAVLADVGVAKAVMTARHTMAGTPPALSPVGAKLGSPPYMAPEQWTAEPDVDQRADLYALGIVTYEMLTGQTPFAHRPELQLFDAHFGETPVPVSQLRGGIPPKFADLVMRCLAKDPGDRPKNASEIVSTIESLTGELPELHIKTPVEHPALRDNQPTRMERFRAWWLTRPGLATAAALVLAIAGGGTAIVYAVTHRGAPAAAPIRVASAAVAATDKSIAVLPFAVPAGDSIAASFADAIALDVADALGAVRGLHVAGSQSAFALRDTSVKDHDAAKRLGVATLLRGEARIAEGYLNVTARLVEPNGQEIWTKSWRGWVKDVPAIRAEIVAGVAEALKLQSASDLATRLTSDGSGNARAVQAYAMGRRLTTSDNLGTIRAGIAYLEQAVALDSGFADAWSALAAGQVRLVQLGARPKDPYTKARAAASHALSLDSALAPAHAALATVFLEYDRDFGGAVREAGRAITTDSNEAEAWAVRARAYRDLAIFDTALVAITRAVALDPLDPRYLETRALLLVADSNWTDAAQDCRAAMAAAPTSVIAHRCMPRVMLAAGRVDDALTALAPDSLSQDTWLRALRGHALALKGDRKNAFPILESLVRASNGAWVQPEPVAVLFSLTRDQASALRWLGYGIEMRSPGAADLMWDPMFDPIRRSPGYTDIVRAAGFPEQLAQRSRAMMGRMLGADTVTKVSPTRR